MFKAGKVIKSLFSSSGTIQSTEKRSEIEKKTIQIGKKTLTVVGELPEKDRAYIQQHQSELEDKLESLAKNEAIPLSRRTEKGERKADQDYNYYLTQDKIIARWTGSKPKRLPKVDKPIEKYNIRQLKEEGIKPTEKKKLTYFSSGAIKNIFTLPGKYLLAKIQNSKKNNPIPYNLLKRIDTSSPHVQSFYVLDYISPKHGTQKQGLIMEEMDGDLETLVKNNTVNIKDLALQMSEGVMALHEQNIFHGDIKLENFLYITDENGKIQVCIADFDLIEKVDEKTQLKAKGTNAYAAPEVLLQYNLRMRFTKDEKTKVKHLEDQGRKKTDYKGKEALKKADVYALGKSIEKMMVLSRSKDKALSDLVAELTNNDSTKRPTIEEANQRLKTLMNSVP